MAKQKVIDAYHDDEFGTICVCAERYALGRQTYMPTLVQDFIKRHVGELETNALVVMRRDLEDAKSSEEDWPGVFGDEAIDKPGWLQFLDFLSKEIEERGDAI